MHVFWFQIIAWFSSLFGQCYQWHIKVEFFPEIYCSYLIKGFFSLKVICEVNLRSTVTRFSFNNRCKHSVPDFFRFFSFSSEGKGREGKGNMHISKYTGLVFHLIPLCWVFTVFFLLCTGLNLIQRLVSIGLSENIFYSNLWTALFLSFEITWI